MEHVRIDPDDLDPQSRHKLTIGSVVPRPIAWITSVDLEGRTNLAPFSYFMACHSYVPALAVSIGSRTDGPTGVTNPSDRAEGDTVGPGTGLSAVARPKDTAANIAATGELVVNLVTSELVETMNLTAAAFPTGIDELEAAGLTPAASTRVGPPRVAESPLAIECRVMHRITLGDPPRESALFVARIVMWHIREDILIDGYKIDQHKLHAVGRMGGRSYARTEDQFELMIPDWTTVDTTAGPNADRTG